ncbi:TPA: hypothetical protein ACF3WV_001849 [Enterococcus hirae]
MDKYFFRKTFYKNNLTRFDDFKIEIPSSITEDKVVWYVVAIAILLLLAITIVGAAVLYCLTNGRRKVYEKNIR